MDPGKVDWAGVQWDRVAPGAREKLVADGDRQLRLLELTEAFQEEGWCMAGHWGVVVDGAMVLEQPGPGDTVVEQKLGAGDGLVLPAGSPHKARVETGGRVLLAMVEQAAPTP